MTPFLRVNAGTARAMLAKGRAPRKGRFVVAPEMDRTIDGRIFASKLEAGRYAYLRVRERLGEIQDLECQPYWDVFIAGKKLCRYTADFTFFDKKCGRVIEETKSSGTAKDAAYRLRRKAAELALGIVVTEVLL